MKLFIAIVLSLLFTATQVSAQTLDFQQQLRRAEAGDASGQAKVITIDWNNL